MTAINIIIRKAKREVPKMEGCIRCGECCGPLNLTNFEFKKIERYLEENNLLVEVKMNYEALTTLGDSYKQLGCYLLRMPKDGKTECMVYPVRPMVCIYQGIKTGLPCKHANNPLMKAFPKWMRRYYDYLIEDGGILNDGLESLLSKLL